MQYAKCTIDNEVWEASKFSQLDEATLENKRRSLICVECKEFAWFRKESTHGHPAHFCAHHDEGCALKVDYIVSDEQRDPSTVDEEQVSSGDTIIVRLDEEQGGSIEVQEVQRPPKDDQGEGGRAYIVRGGNRESLQQFTLRRILLRLVQSPEFRTSNRKIVFYKNADEVMIQGDVKNIVVSFDDINKESHHEQTMFYWGPIASAGKTEDGKIWLNSSRAYHSASISIFSDISEEFLKLFQVSDLEDLAGAYVLVAGKCYFTGQGEGKPVIWCGTPKYIFVRKYRAEHLQISA